MQLERAILTNSRQAALAAYALIALITGHASTSAAQNQVDSVVAVASVGNPLLRPAGEWTVLFDGTSLASWRTYGQQILRPQWQIEDGALTLTQAGGGDITFGNVPPNFEFELEWKVSAGGNSGVFYLVDPRDETKPHWHSGPEMQILDDAAHPDRLNPATRAGALFALYAPQRRVVRPAGQWNRARLVIRNRNVEHWLNGARIVQTNLDSPEFAAMARASKFSPFHRTAFGKSQSGLILLQDHADKVQFRNIRIKVLP